MTPRASCIWTTLQYEGLQGYRVRSDGIVLSTFSGKYLMPFLHKGTSRAWAYKMGRAPNWRNIPVQKIFDFLELNIKVDENWVLWARGVANRYNQQQKRKKQQYSEEQNKPWANKARIHCPFAAGEIRDPWGKLVQGPDYLPFDPPALDPVALARAMPKGRGVFVRAKGA